jgi:hypothetical protein
MRLNEIRPRRAKPSAGRDTLRPDARTEVFGSAPCPGVPVAAATSWVGEALGVAVVAGEAVALGVAVALWLSVGAGVTVGAVVAVGAGVAVGAVVAVGAGVAVGAVEAVGAGVAVGAVVGVGVGVETGAASTTCTLSTSNTAAGLTSFV